jgi:hypothetical protein
MNDEIIKVGEKTGIKVEEYNGTYRLQACYKGYVQWAKYKVGKDAYAEKDRPVSVELGDLEQAKNALKLIYNRIAGK